MLTKKVGRRAEKRLPPRPASSSQVIHVMPLGIASDKGSSSNPLLPVSTLHSGLFNVSDYLLKILPMVKELEQTPTKLKEAYSEINRLSSENAKLISAYKTQAEALKQANAEVARLKEEGYRTARESIISYTATDTFVSHRMTEFWSNVESLILPYITTFVNYVRNVKGLDVPEFDPVWLTHGNDHEFQKLWGGKEEPSQKMDPISEKPEAEKVLWDLEERGEKRRTQLEERGELANAGQALAAVVAAGRRKEKRVRISETDEVRDLSVTPSVDGGGDGSSADGSERPAATDGEEEAP